MKISLLLFLLLTSSISSADTSIKTGQQNFIIKDSKRNRQISTYVWYPADPSSQMTTSTLKGPFLPVISAQNAPFSKTENKYPVVLLSHGSMGLANRLFWLADYLAKNGVIVIAVDHPGNMFGDSSADGLMRVWDRALDLTFALEEITKRLELGRHIDHSRISAIGFSAGGAAVLLLGGARFSFDQFANPIPNCQGSQDPFYNKQCHELSKINPKDYGKRVVEADYSNDKMKSIVALDPGFFRSFSQETIKLLKTKRLILIAERLAVPQDEIFSRDFIKVLGPEEAKVVPGSEHMTFLQACRPDIPVDKDPELKELCADTAAKLKIQETVSDEILNFLKSSWSKRNPEIVNFKSGSLNLRGELYLPEGKGPFPAILYNHGSAPGMLSSEASKVIAPLFTSKGWIFFMPYRRGQGLSASAGNYIGDELKHAFMLGKDKAAEKLVELLKGEHLADQLAAHKWLQQQNFVTKSRIAVAGNSFGGIQTVLGAARENYCAAVDASGGAESWAKAPGLQTLMKESVRASKSPIFFFQAANDFDLSPSKVLAEEMKSVGKKSELKIYPAFGQTEKDGHSFPYAGAAIWFEDVFKFVTTHCQ